MRRICLAKTANHINFITYTQLFNLRANMRKTQSVVLIRHGESEWNNQNLFCGWYDAELCEQGYIDAITISAAALVESNIKFDCAYTSTLKRAQHSLAAILKELNLCDLPKKMDWRLNERHYGNLIGFNKREMADKYGEEKVQIWRRSFDVRPPPIVPENPYYQSIRCNPSFKDVPAELFPDTESMKDVLDRVKPLWEDEILAQIVCGKNVLVVAHGTVVRALIKHIDDISDKDISSLNVPNSIPCLTEIDVETRKPIAKIKFLAEENFLNRQMEKTASLGKLKP